MDKYAGNIPVNNPIEYPPSGVLGGSSFTVMTWKNFVLKYFTQLVFQILIIST